MDIQQLRSGLFELFEPLENERQYIVYDEARGNLLVDVPEFGARPVRLIQGTGRTALIVATNAARAKEAQRYRDELGVRVAAHADDAQAVPGVDLVLSDDEMVRPDVRAIRVKAPREGATVLLVRKAGNVLICGDLDLASDAAKQLEPLEFTAVLSARRPPIWNAGKDTLLMAQRELPKPNKQFSILLPPPWDRAYTGRLEDKMVNNDKIVPTEETAPREAAMGPATLVVAREARDRIERAKRPLPAAVSASAGGGTPPPPPKETKRPKPFAEDWSAPGSERPAGTIANSQADIVPAQGTYQPQSIGARFQRVAIEDVVGTAYVDWIWGGLDLAPDASEVAFAWNKTGTFEIYSAPLDRDRIFQLTDAKERSVSPRWSPDGRQVAFLRDHGGDECFDVWLVDRDGEHERKLTNEPQAMQNEISWSPDGSRIAYTSNAPGRFKVFTVDVRSGATKQITEGDFDDGQPRWSPDGMRLVFFSRRDAVPTNSDLYIVSAEGGTATRLETRGGVDGVSLDATFSPDGARLGFTTNTRGRYETAIAHLEGNAVARVERLTENIHDEYEPVWRPDGRGLVYTHNEDAELSLRRVFAVSHATHPVADRPGVHYAARFGPDSDLVAFIYSGAREPTDVYVTRERMVAPQRITHSLPDAVDPDTLVEPVHVRYPGADGREIPALLYVPYAEAVRGTGKPPAIMYVHGGPTAQHFHQWDRTAQWLANSGYVVIAPNIRGSTGYGREFQEANRGDWGGKDLRDVVLGAEWLVKQGIADAKRIGVHGGSYGGFMTLMVLSQAPDVWAAGVSVVGVVSWSTMWGTTRGDLKEYLAREFGDPAKVPALYRDRSPLTHVSKIKAPLLLLQGANDPRVPRLEAQLMIDALRKGGKTFDEHIYEGEGHGFRTRDNLIDSLRRATEWFDRYLAPRA